MARKQKLKVYRTPIGFHDAYVAAPSQKAALKAWGTDTDLFARGVAEMVDDEQLTKTPLEKPGTVVRVLRGSNAEHMAALPKEEPARQRSTAPAEDDGPLPRRRKRPAASHETRHAKKVEEAFERHSPRPAPKPKHKTQATPRPSRARLDEAEKALELAEAQHNEAIAAIREQERQLQQQRHDTEKHFEATATSLESAIAKARRAYEAALQKWQV